MSRPKQTKVYTREEIEKRIDRANSKKSELLATAERYNALGKSHAEFFSNEEAGFAFEQAKKAMRAHERLERIRLPKLKQALAAMDTELLGFDDDRSVVL